MNKYILDIEHLLKIAEPIVMKYIVIEDIDLCIFNSNLRYPLDRKTVVNTQDSNTSHISREPTLAMYAAPMFKDLIKFLFAKNSKYYEKFKLPLKKCSNAYELFEYKPKSKLDIIKMYLGNDIIHNESDLDQIEELVDTLEEYIVGNNIPCDYIIEIDDECRNHIITLKKHILEERISEIGLM